MNILPEVINYTFQTHNFVSELNQLFLPSLYVFAGFYKKTRLLDVENLEINRKLLFSIRLCVI